MDGLMPIGAAAQRIGVAVSALRYWEECGLVEPAERRSGRRFYGEEELRRMVLIQVWQGTGLLSLEEIRELLAGSSAGRDWRDPVRERIRAIDEQAERLAEARAYLEHLLTCPSEDPARKCSYIREAVQERLDRPPQPSSRPKPPAPPPRGSGPALHAQST